jgi:LD-carboxypeptidase C-terminal domain
MPPLIQATRFGRRLPKGGCIGVPAPASPWENRSDLLRGVEWEKCDWSERRPEWPRTKSLEQVLEEHLEPLGVLVLYRLPLGHARHLATLPLGVAATLDADRRTLVVDQPALR